MTLICNIYKDIDNLLPHFLEHYYKLGVLDFYFGIHSGENNSVWDRIDSFNKWGLRIKKWKTYDGPICGNWEGWYQEFLRQQVQDGWVITTDLDEFHNISGYKTYQELIDYCIKNDFTWAVGRTIDRTTKDGSIPLAVNPNIPISEQFPVRCRITKPLLDAWDVKMVLSRQDVTFHYGHHWVREPGPGKDDPHMLPTILETNHFKWFGNLRQKEKEKLEAYKKFNLPYYQENERLLNHLRNHDNKLVGDPIEILSS